SQAAAFCRSPDRGLAGALLHGEDPGAVATRRRELVGALLDGDTMRLERLDPGTLRRDPAALDSALRARGFFGGRGVVLIDGATDTLTTMLAPALSETSPDDAFLVVTSGLLTGKSTLRRLFETSKPLVSLQFNAESASPAEIVSRLTALGATGGVSDNAQDLLASLAAAMDAASFDRLLETIATYAMDASRAIDVEDVAALAPSGLDAELDAFVAAVAGGRPEAIGPLLRRVTAAGATPVGLLLGLQRHFRQLLLAASTEGGTEAGLGRIRPPLWGVRRDTMRTQLGKWRRDRLEAAARLLFEADARVRSADRVPAMALVERCALRLAMMAGR
ncbi:MAG TPA: DNA polymerase III subunit delta, partial [Paracoccaceae bacterium]|nr:DNA polymerase III subunit delta [Paracoccaceae bacterium]